MSSPVPKDESSYDKAFSSIIIPAFWDTYLKNDPNAKEWFSNGGFEKLLAGDGIFEKK